MQSYRHIKLKHILLFLLGLILTGGSWFIIQIMADNIDVVKDFIIYQVRLFSTEDAGHGGFPGYHVVILLLGVFPASVFLFGGFKGMDDETDLQKAFRRVSIILLLTVIVLFETVQTKIVHYSSLAYFPLTFLSALYIHRIIRGKQKFSVSSKIMLIAIGIIWVAAMIGLVVTGLNKDWLIQGSLLKDPFAKANLGADVIWSGWEIMVVLILVVGIFAFFFIKKSLSGIIVLFSAGALFTFATLFVFTGKIEGYTQQAALEFYRQHSREDGYISTLGFKSYAHLFYGEVMPQDNPHYNDKEWLLQGKTDKPAYFVYKITKREEYERIYPHLTILYEKNGFIFAARYPGPENN